ncbi:hypothetical protein B1218_38585, partial [Pseudomonas ogarae]
GKPLAVGGSADRRGVIATVNYEPRAHGGRPCGRGRAGARRCRAWRAGVGGGWARRQEACRGAGGWRACVRG